MTTYEAVLNEATQLPVEQRVQLIDALWETVPEEAALSVSQEWFEEIERRSAEYNAGLVETIPWETVRDESRRQAGLPVNESLTPPDISPASSPLRR